MLRLRFRECAVISIASEEHPVVVRPWPGGENRIGERASHHEEFEAIGSSLLTFAATGLFPGRGVVPERCNPLEAVVDACRDTTTCVRWAKHAADGGVVCVP